MNWTKTRDARIKKRGEFYWARFTKFNRKVEESLGTRSFATAARVADEIESCLLLGVDWRKDRELFETAWPDFLSDKARGIKTKIAREATLTGYIGFGERYFLPFFKDHRLTEIDEGAWIEFVNETRKTKPDMLFFNPRKYLMGFLSWAKRKGKIKEMPEFYKPDARPDEDEENEGPGKEYSTAELEELRALASGKFKLCLFMAMYMGMRSGEITQLKKSRIDWKYEVIRLRKVDTKNAEARAVPIHDEVKPLLLDQFNANGFPYLFPNVRDKQRPMDTTGFKRAWNDLRLEAGVVGRFHDFKHTWITIALRSGMNVAAVSKIVGTSILVIEKVYLHLKVEDLTREIKKYRVDIPWTQTV